MIMRSNEYPSAEITLRIEVRRVRMSATQGEAAVYINGSKIIQFGDKIEMIAPGEKYYGPLIGDWASKKDDAGFIRGLLFHPLDDVYHYSESVKNIINRECADRFPGTIRGEDHNGRQNL